jgi:hypothetical protein
LVTVTLALGAVYLLVRDQDRRQRESVPALSRHEARRTSRRTGGGRR